MEVVQPINDRSSRPLGKEQTRTGVGCTGAELPPPGDTLSF
jgi:hypothetical protein